MHNLFFYFQWFLVLIYILGNEEGHRPFSLNVLSHTHRLGQLAQCGRLVITLLQAFFNVKRCLKNYLKTINRFLNTTRAQLLFTPQKMKAIDHVQVKIGFADKRCNFFTAGDEFQSS